MACILLDNIAVYVDIVFASQCTFTDWSTESCQPNLSKSVDATEFCSPLTEFCRWNLSKSVDATEFCSPSTEFCRWNLSKSVDATEFCPLICGNLAAAATTIRRRTAQQPPLDSPHRRHHRSTVVVAHRHLVAVKRHRKGEPAAIGTHHGRATITPIQVVHHDRSVEAILDPMRPQANIDHDDHTRFDPIINHHKDDANHFLLKPHLAVESPQNPSASFLLPARPGSVDPGCSSHYPPAAPVPTSSTSLPQRPSMGHDHRIQAIHRLYLCCSTSPPSLVPVSSITACTISVAVVTRRTPAAASSNCCTMSNHCHRLLHATSHCHHRPLPMSASSWHDRGSATATADIIRIEDVVAAT
ncbi:hypothetical protein ACLOJK_019568, partial [Asimina triloba]